MQTAVLKYHHAIFDLLDRTPVISETAQALIAEREKACGVTFPASVKEYFSVEGAVKLFGQQTPHYLTLLNELGKPEEVAQGYLHVATENQAVVLWFARLDGSEDPAVYHDDNRYFDLEFSAINWAFNSATFTNFIFDMLSDYHFSSWKFPSGSRLTAVDKVPDNNLLDKLRYKFREGPFTDLPDVKVHRFYNKHGLIRISYAVAQNLALAKAEWIIEADGVMTLETSVESIWHYGTLSRTLQPDSYSPPARLVLGRLKSAQSP